MMTDIEKTNLIHIAKHFKRDARTYASEMKKSKRYSDGNVYCYYFNGLSDAYDYAYQDLCELFPFLEGDEDGED